VQCHIAKGKTPTPETQSTARPGHQYIERRAPVSNLTDRATDLTIVVIRHERKELKTPEMYPSLLGMYPFPERFKSLSLAHIRHISNSYSGASR